VPETADLPPASTVPEAVLVFETDPAELTRLLRAPVLQGRRDGRVRVSGANTIWHDTADGDLAARGLALGQRREAGREVWRLERLFPDGTLDWLPSRPAPVLAEAAAPAELDQPLPAPLTPIAAFNGRLREFPLLESGSPARLSVLEGVLRGVAQDRPACRVLLSGDAAAMAALAHELADHASLRIPRAGLAAQAIAVARGQPPAPHHLGAPAVPTGLTVDEALTYVTAHLADVILHWATLIPGCERPEPVHQMRVGVRRLRSALSVFRRAVEDGSAACPWLDDLTDRLKALAAQLGRARDWDVFLAETGADISRVLPADRRIAQMIAAAGRKRAAAYADLAVLLAGRDWSQLEMTLALLPTLRPWNHAARAAEPAAVLASPAKDYAAHALDRRLKHVLAPGADLSGLPAEQLHETRKQAKRLRYATEFFAPLFSEKSIRKYLPRLEDLQEDLGAVNDTAVAAHLMAQLGTGGDRAFAAGAVMGFGAARHSRAQRRVRRAWDRFYRATPFWD
jgi:CHAD domain-containing protein